jgi:hypothetical protein
VEKYLVVTIDVEPDCSPSWDYSNPLKFSGVKVGIHKRLQPLFNRYNIKPSYLINNVVLEDKESIEIFKKLHGSFELGTHLHPEFIEPEKEFHIYSGKRGTANCCHYSPQVEFEKIRTITKLFENAFGRAPTSFRAGRFSAGTNTIESLSKLGYKVDSSVTPYVIWKDKTRNRAIDFRQASNQPYFVGKESIVQKDPNGTILEVPVTIVRRNSSLLTALKKMLQKKTLSLNFHSAAWLRPVYSTVSDFDWIMQSMVTNHLSSNILVYNIMFHNVEVMPLLSPYTKSETDCIKYLQLLEWLFIYAQKKNIKSVGLSDLYDLYKRK